MIVTPQQVELFKTFFGGMSEGHGVSRFSGVVRTSDDEKNGKIEAMSGWQKETLNDELWYKHLKGESINDAYLPSWKKNEDGSKIEGKNMLGICPITSESKVRWCAIDVDKYATPEQNKELVKTIYRFNMPILPFRTKSGGLHLYLFFNDFITGQQGRIFINAFRRAFGMDVKTELFPKQTTIKQGDKGGWLNMPYFGHEETDRFLIRRDLDNATLDECLISIKQNLQTLESIKEFLNTLPFSDGPPCLQTISIQGETDHRNNYLFNVARYAKTKHGEDFPHVVELANSELTKPLEDREVLVSVIRTFTKKDYAYKCKEAPIVSFCDKAECKLREYGVGGQHISPLNYEELTQYKTDPPYYEWKIDGALLKFFSEQEILNQQVFRAMVFRMLNTYPYRVEDSDWTKIINTAAANIKIVEMDIEDDISPGGIFKRHLVTFLMDRSLTAQKKHLLTGNVYEDTEMGVFVFQPHRFLEYLQRQDFKGFSTVEIQSRIKDFAGKPITYDVIDEASGAEAQKVRVWAIPKNVIAPNTTTERDALKSAIMTEPVTSPADESEF
jgi:hypothetical protein